MSKMGMIFIFDGCELYVNIFVKNWDLGVSNLVSNIYIKLDIY